MKLLTLQLNPIVMLKRHKHKHLYSDENNTEFISATTFLKAYDAPVDYRYWAWVAAVAEAVGGKEEFKKIRPHWEPEENWLSEMTAKLGVERIMARREEIYAGYGQAGFEGRTKGTARHTALEKIDRERGRAFYDLNSTWWPIGKASEEDDEYIYWPKGPAELTPGYCYLEIGLCMDFLAGTADSVFTVDYKNQLYVSVKDHKTDKKFRSTGLRKMLYPVDDLDACEFNKYSLQLSLYALMFEKHGYFVKDLWVLRHSKTFPLKFMPKHIEKMITHHLNLKEL